MELDDLRKRQNLEKELLEIEINKRELFGLGEMDRLLANRWVKQSHHPAVEFYREVAQREQAKLKKLIASWREQLAARHEAEIELFKSHTVIKDNFWLMAISCPGVRKITFAQLFVKEWAKASGRRTENNKWCNSGDLLL